MSIGPLSPTLAVVTKLVIKPDEADEVSAFLADAVRLANQEQAAVTCGATDRLTDSCRRAAGTGHISSPLRPSKTAAQGRFSTENRRLTTRIERGDVDLSDENDGFYW
jgi:hypothetical protein